MAGAITGGLPRFERKRYLLLQEDRKERPTKRQERESPWPKRRVPASVKVYGGGRGLFSGGGSSSAHLLHSGSPRLKRIPDLAQQGHVLRDGGRSAGLF